MAVNRHAQLATPHFVYTCVHFQVPDALCIVSTVMHIFGATSPLQHHVLYTTDSVPFPRWKLLSTSEIGSDSNHVAT